MTVSHLTSYQNIPPLRCDIFEDVTLLPMLYVDANPITSFALGAYAQGKAIAEVHRFIWGKQYSKQLPPMQAQKILHEEVIYGGVFLGHWGHFLIESLQRLWYTKQCKLPIVWLRGQEYHKNTPFFTAAQEEVFRGLGIENSHIFLQEPLQFSKVHIPQPGFELGHYAHPEHLQFLGYHEGEVRKGKYVYISRSHFPGCINEKALETRLQALGWEIVFPEQLSVSEQLHVLTNAEVCLLFAGSAQHTLLCAKNSNTRFIVIPRVHNITYDLISNFKAKHYYLLHAEKKVVNEGMGNNRNKFSIDVDALQDIILKTQNFTADLAPFAPFITVQNPVPEQCLHVPTSYAKADTSLGEAEGMYYKALYYAQKNRMQEAYALCMALYDGKMLQTFMYDYFFDMVEKYQKLTGEIAPVSLQKNHYMLQKAMKNVAENPEHGEHYLRLAEALQHMQRFDAALEVMQKATNKFPHWALPLAGLAQMHMTKGEKNLALRAAQKAFRLDPQDSKVKEVLAYCLHKQG